MGHIPYAWDSFKTLLRETPIKIAIAATLGATIASGISYHHESTRDYNIPLSFSEKTQLERDAERKEKKLGPMTVYLTTTNDATMNVFESYNLAGRPILPNVDHTFAMELEMVMDPTYKTHHYSLAELLKAIPYEADAALEELKDFNTFRGDLGTPLSHFDSSWNESHIDHYRTEWRTVCSTDSKGNSDCHQESYQVYDHTTHTYTYHPDSGEKASTTLDALLLKCPVLKFPEILPVPSQTNAEGEYVAEKTHPKKEGETIFSPERYMSIATIWRRGSTLMTNLPIISENVQALRRDANYWRLAKRTAKSDSYNTPSPIDNGPAEFQVVDHTKKHGRTTQRAIGEIVEGVSKAKNIAPKLERTIQEYIAVVLDHKPGNARKLRSEILDLTREIYNGNFKSGEDVDGFRWWMVALLTLGGAAMGGLIGYGWDHLGNELEWYEDNLPPESRWENRHNWDNNRRS